MSDWDKLTPAQRAAATLARKRSGHTSLGEQLRLVRREARADAFIEAIGFLRRQQFHEAATQLEAAAFEFEPAVPG